MKNKINIPKTFFGFLTASIFFWLLINLSKEYNSTVQYDLEYTQLPQQKTLIETPFKKITINVKSSGYNLLTSSINHKPITLQLNKAIKKRGNNYYFLSKNILSDVQNQLKSGIQLINIQQDTIPLTIGTLNSKKVPIKPNTNITFQLGYDLSKPINTIPDSVLISGDENDINKIQFLELQKTSLENISKNTNTTSAIVFPEGIKLKSSHQSAQIELSVDKFTEGEIEVPVFVKNAPKGINIFPKKVKIIYKVGLKNFNSITPDLFKIECDYLESTKKELNYLIPKLKEFPEQISTVRIVPKKIDFLIYE
ncbi:YbbR-like domain-containing protein [Tenacibaculum crassostreae]|uniref:hypothetical protein n=1 Tax=Tenacibaculum crassostreae TaxID=502683 RepID=UPI0038958979